MEEQEFQTKLRDYLDRFVFFLKQNSVYIIIILVAILIQIPRTKGMLGSDAFEILWMAKALEQNLSQNTTWLIDPLSYFGYYPYSFYPIGFPFFISIFLKIGFSIEAIVILFSYCEIIVAGVGIVKLSRIFFEKKIYQYSSLISYLFAPIFIRLTYFTLTARGPILALTPWFFYYLFRSKEKQFLGSAIKQITILLLMIMIHRLWVAFIPLVVIFFISHLILRYVEIKKTIDKRKIVFYIIFTILTIGFMSLGYYYFRIDQSKITSPWFSNESVFGLLINLVIDYGLRIGIFALFLPFGIYFMIKGDSFNEEKHQELTWFKLICSTLFISFVWTYTVYSTVAYLPMYILIMNFGLRFIFEHKKKNSRLFALIVLLGFSFLYSLAYSLLFSNSYVYPIIFLVIVIIPTTIYLVLSNLEKTKFKVQKLLIRIKKEHIVVACLITANIIFSLTTVDGQIITSEEEFPYSYISQDEIDMCNFLSSENITGYIYVANFQVSRRIGGYGFFPTINANHHAQQLYYGWVTQEEIRNNLTFNFYYFLTNPNILTGLPTPEMSLVSEIQAWQVNSSAHLNRLIDNKIQYAVVLKDSNGILYPYHSSIYGVSFSLFIESLNNLPVLFETEHLMLFKIY